MLLPTTLQADHPALRIGKANPVQLLEPQLSLRSTGPSHHEADRARLQQTTLPASVWRSALGARASTASTTNKTTDHDEIKRWVSEHDGSPAIVGDTRTGGSGVLRFDFPGGAGPDELEHV